MGTRANHLHALHQDPAVLVEAHHNQQHHQPQQQQHIAGQQQNNSPAIFSESSPVVLYSPPVPVQIKTSTANYHAKSRRPSFNSPCDKSGDNFKSAVVDRKKRAEADQNLNYAYVQSFVDNYNQDDDVFDLVTNVVSSPSPLRRRVRRRRASHSKTVSTKNPPSPASRLGLRFSFAPCIVESGSWVICHENTRSSGRKNSIQ